MIKELISENNEQYIADVVDIGFDEELVIDDDWLLEFGYREILKTGKYNESRDLTILYLNGEFLGLDEEVLIPYWTKERGLIEARGTIRYSRSQNLYLIWEDLHNEHIEINLNIEPLMYFFPILAKRVK